MAFIACQLVQQNENYKFLRLLYVLSLSTLKAKSPDGKL